MLGTSIREQTFVGRRDMGTPSADRTAERRDGDRADQMHLLYRKYEHIQATVQHLEPSTVSMMYKEVQHAHTFFPNVGLFFNEFALCYCASLNTNKK